MKWDARYKTIVIKLLYMSRYNFCNCFVGCPFHDVSPGVPVAVKIIDKAKVTIYYHNRSIIFFSVFIWRYPHHIFKKLLKNNGVTVTGHAGNLHYGIGYVFQKLTRLIDSIL